MRRAIRSTSRGLSEMARTLRPKLITIGASLNLFPHPLREMRAIADEVGAKLLFDAAHLSGTIAGARLAAAARGRRPSDDDEHL